MQQLRPVCRRVPDGRTEGSVRHRRFAEKPAPEDDHDLLLGRIRELDLPEEAYAWYLDLRKYGTYVHSGFGLGVERTVGWICGIPHVREAIAFPRTMTRLYP